MISRVGHSAPANKDTAGFTLVEMITVVGIVAVMGALAIPAFSRMIARNEVQQAAREIAATVQTSRLLAMNVNAAVGVLPALVAGQDGQMLQLTVVNANTGAALTNPITGAAVSAGLQVKATNITSLTSAGGGPANQAIFNPQGLLAPVGTPGVVWVITNAPLNYAYSVTVSPGGRVRWCEGTVAAGGVCP